MASFMIVTRVEGTLNVRPLVAADLAAAEALIETVLKRQMLTGRAGGEIGSAVTSAFELQQQATVNGEALIGIVQLDAGAKIQAGANAANPIGNWNNRQAAAIPDLPAYTGTTLANANTAIAAIGVKTNAILAALRSYGVIAP